MKKFIISLLFLSLPVIFIDAQEISASENALLDNFIKSRIVINKKLFKSDTLARVFDGNFYKIDAGFEFSDVNTLCSGDIFTVRNGKINVLDARTDSMPVMLSLIRKDFFLKTETDARYFESCLDLFSPISDYNKNKKEHLKIGNKWYFIRDTFFDSKSGYVVTIDKNSKIIHIAVEMEALKK